MELERAAKQFDEEIAKNREIKLKTMSERELRADVTERRLGIKPNKCSCCGKPFAGYPFERLTYSYCSVACVATHRQQLESNK